MDNLRAGSSMRKKELFLMTETNQYSIKDVRATFYERQLHSLSIKYIN